MSDEEVKKVPTEGRGSTTAEAVGKNPEPEDLSAEAEEVLEFELNEDGEEDFKKTLKKFREDLKACQREKGEYLTGWQKERADFVNYKKGEDDRRIMFSESVREHILTRFLAVSDSFNMAFANRESWDKVDENWRRGVEYIYNQLNSIFEEYGVKEIGEVGESFDPNIHQSIELLPTDKKEEDHKVSNVIQKGYKLGEHVMRPARVNVYEYKEPVE